MNIGLYILGGLIYMFIGALWAVVTKKFDWLPFHNEELSYLVGIGIIIGPVMLAIDIGLYILILLWYCTVNPLHWFFYGIAKRFTDKR